EVEIDLAIGRTVEQSHRRLAIAAGCARAAFIDHDAGGRRVDVAELRGPDVIDVGADLVDEQAFLVPRRPERALALGRAAACDLVGYAAGDVGVDSEVVGGDGDDDRDAAAPGNQRAATHSAPVLNPAARASASPAHAHFS